MTSRSSRRARAGPGHPTQGCHRRHASSAGASHAHHHPGGQVAGRSWSAGRPQDYQVSANVFGGDVDVESSRSKTESALHVSATAIDLSELRGSRPPLTCPVWHTGDETRREDARPARRCHSGSLTWTCRACALGDGKAKLIIRATRFWLRDWDFPRSVWRFRGPRGHRQRRGTPAGRAIQVA